MRRKSLVAAVAIGFLTFALSLASVTKAQAECKEFGPFRDRHFSSGVDREGATLCGYIHRCLDRAL
jgi:hypothetical protein